jgi:hypothetical protein
MKFLIVQGLIAVLSVILLYYFSTIDYFLPYFDSGSLNWYAIGTVLFLSFLFLQSVISVVLFLTQKFMAYGWKEFPHPSFATKWGVGLSLGTVVLLLLNAFHILTLQWGLILLGLVALVLLIL